MDISKQVVSLEQAKRLKELGVCQLSVACYMGGELSLFEQREYDWALAHGYEAMAAFTVAELIVAIGMCWHSTRIDGAFAIGLELEIQKPFTHFLTKPCAAGSGSILIHLLESGAVTADEVNARLSAA